MEAPPSGATRPRRREARETAGGLKWQGQGQGGPGEGVPRGSVTHCCRCRGREPSRTLHRDRPRDGSDCTAGRYPDGARSRIPRIRDARRPVRRWATTNLARSTHTTTRANGVSFNGRATTETRVHRLPCCRNITLSPSSRGPPSSAARDCARNPPHASYDI